MTMTWKQVKEHLGVAIHNFVHGTPYAMRLTVGEMVQILAEYGDWYYGRSKFKGTCGIFPKSYIHILQQSVNMDCLIHEITNVLREWGHHWKHLYVIHSMHFRTMQQQILELIGYRSKILSGTLTVDELKDVKRLATARIDTGNQLLGMDMVVRDDQGNVLSPEETSTIQLYYHHETAAERIRKAANDTKHKPSKPQAPVYSHIFFISVRNFVCKMAEDVELLLTLYDGREMKAITENYVVSWSKEGLARDIDQLHNLRVLFTDLGSRDLTRDKVYLVCYVIRVGGMEAKDADHRRSSVAQTNQKVKNTENMRRPFGVAAMDITLYISGKLEGDSDHHHFIPFVHCEKESLDGTLRRILSQKEINIQKSSNGNSGSSAGGQGLWASLKLLRGDPKQVRDENPHLVLGNVAIARKMGFPEVILPGDVRNDLYLTLISGEFNKGSKSTDKNVEVTVKVCNEFGVPIPGVMTLGGGVSPIDEYHSVIYYHEDKPRWCETFKIAIPIEEFKQAHLKFTFKHRSSNEAKDKSEKPFALSYVKLMQRNGTTLQDIQHELLVYKLDPKKYEEIDISYLKLPSTRGELVELNLEKKPTLGALTLSSKDSFLIATNICSTKLTQNVDLLGLLNWASHNTNLKESLIALMKVDGEEVVKFLQDVLDALFNILMSNSDSDIYDDMVFECLLYIIGLVSDRKYQHFQPVMDLYISESFSATLAYKKLISVLRKRIDNATNNDGQERDILLKTMKSLQYCMRFVVESRLLFTALNQDEEEFSQTLTELLRSIVELMRHETDSTLLVQGACLKYLPTTIPHLLRVYSGKQLSTILTDLLVTLPVGRLTKQKMMTVNDIVHSPLFLSAECRAILLPRITILVRDLLEAKEEGLSSTPGNSVAKVARLLGEKRHRLNQHRGYSEEVELCVKILSDILELTFRKDIGSTIQDVKEIMLTALRTIIQTVISMDRENPLVGNLVSVMLAIFRQMTQHHYEIYINHFGTKFDLLDFLMEILLVFKDLVSKSVFPGDWCEMIMLQNSIILKSLRYFSGTIRDYFFTDFEQQAWSNFFHCAIAFLTQPALQLETFTPSKRNRIVLRYNDMRRETAFEIRSMWFNLGQHKILFVPGLVGAILEMALIPETELRKATIPIFFDMMQCEFYSSRIVEGYGDTKRDPAHIKANFTEYENEMIAKLDILVEGGRGDEQFRLLWIQVMGNLCEKHSTMREQGLRFVDTVAKLMERLLQYRDIIHAESQEHRMLCIVNLLEFYSEINRKEMYIRYVNKLCELHLECDNYTEAAYSLKLHSQLLAWSDQPLPPLLRSHRYLACQTHRELKEALYNDMIEYFDKGKMWECALAVCKELVTQYEEETFDYLQLSVLLTRMAKFYDSIVKQLRPEPEYFRVAYYGRGHPAFLQNKVFIYRGKEYERLSDFCSRTLNQLPNAEQMNKLSPPTSEVLESNHQYVQINRVDPLMDEKRHRLSGKPITAEAVLRYHRVNDVQRFRFSRPAPKKDLTSTTANSGDKETNTVTSNEFAALWLERTVLVTSHPLPGILRCFPVTSSETYLVSPLRNAIETMEATNTTLRDLILAHRADNNIPLNPLSMKLNGILDPAVMGGIDNYEEISEINRQCHRALHGSRRSLVAEEVRRVQSRHRRVLGELNLSVEAMLMPTVADNNDEDEPQDQRGASTEELLSSVSPTDDLLSPVGCDMDSGFSGSSSASYRSGLGSLRRGMGKTSTPELAGGQRKTKAAMIWKKGWKGWKKLHSFGNNSNKTDEPRSRCRSWDDVGPTKMETVGQTHRQHHPSLEATRSNTSTQSARSEDSWCSASDHDLSSDDESEKSNISIKSNCQLRNTLHKARTLCDKWRPQNMRVNNADPLDSPGNHGRLSRWFSIRRGSTQQYDVDSSDTVSLTSPIKTPQMPQLCEVEEENSAMVQFQCMQQRRQTPPALPPTPPNLTPQQLKRRHIVAAIVHSENSYVSTLQRLVNDYKKPLEESSPPILSQAKIVTLFHRLPEILQCHTLFRIALAECVRSWDKDEKLGDVFVASFSKAIVLDIYSGFINNFSVAMDLAKQESKRKTALADFFKVKQISAHDRLSFFGLMVKPVQRFPQFILFLQDLLKHTPQGHHDRMSLQLALTQLESLAEMLNERKREAEQFQAFKEMLRHVSGKLSHRPLSSSSRYLIREDNVTQLEFNQNGMITKSKRRRLLLLNDLVVCVSVTPRSAEDFSGSERLTLKWTYPVSDIEIQDTSTSPTLSRLLTAGLNKCGSLKSDKSGDCGQVGADSLCVEMNDLMHDYEVMSRISDLVAQLKGKYEGMTLEKTKQILQSIQLSIQQKDEDMVWADSCCLQLVTKQGQMYTFQTENPLVKKDWITELRLAQLALDPNNSPSWEVPEQEQRPSTKMPLFVSSQQVYHSQHQTEVRCGCYYTTQNPRPTRRRGRSQSYLWICTGDGISSHVTVFGQSTTASATSLKQITAFDLVETRVAAIEFVKGVSSDPLSLASDLVWMGTDSRKILIYIASEPEKQEELGNYSVSGPVIQIKYHCDNVFVALGIGLLLLFKRQVDGTWNLRDPFVISLGSEPVSCLMPINASVYAACGKKVWVLNAVSGDITKSFSAQHEHVGSVKLMAHSGVGLWVALKNSSTVCLYHTETFKHLQDINIASNVLRVTRSNNASNSCGDNLNNNQTAVTVTALLACKGLLWVGTNVGISLTIPLPRLEGVPIISGRVNISYHAHFGPITFLLAIQNPKNTISCTTDEIADEETVQLRSKESDSSRNRDRASLDSSMSNSILKLKQQLASSPVMLRRKRSKEYEYRGSKTLPRGLGSGGGFLSSSMSGSQSSGENCDVYGLYGELMYVKDYENENSSGIDLIYEPLRRSDPELAAIPNKVSTLDRRLKMKITRPRSLDLSNWSVDSHASSLYTSSGSEENLSLKTGKLSRNSSTASRNGPYETTTPNSSIAQSVPETISPPNNLKTNGKKINKTLQQIEQPKKTVLTLMGGRGYINWRQLNAQSVTDKGSKSGYTFKDPNSNDAHIVLWEMKL